MLSQQTQCRRETRWLNFIFPRNSLIVLIWLNNCCSHYTSHSMKLYECHQKNEGNFICRKKEEEFSSQPRKHFLFPGSYIKMVKRNSFFPFFHYRIVDCCVLSSVTMKRLLVCVYVVKKRMEEKKLIMENHNPYPHCK